MDEAILPTDRFIKGIEDWLMDKNYFFINADDMMNIILHVAQVDDPTTNQDAMYSGWDTLSMELDDYRDDTSEDCLAELEQYLAGKAIEFRRLLSNTVWADSGFDGTFLSAPEITADRDLIVTFDRD